MKTLSPKLLHAFDALTSRIQVLRPAIHATHTRSVTGLDTVLVACTFWMPDTDPHLELCLSLLDDDGDLFSDGHIEASLTDEYEAATLLQVVSALDGPGDIMIEAWLGAAEEHLLGIAFPPPAETPAP